MVQVWDRFGRGDSLCCQDNALARFAAFLHFLEDEIDAGLDGANFSAILERQDHLQAVQLGSHFHFPAVENFNSSLPVHFTGIRCGFAQQPTAPR